MSAEHRAGRLIGAWLAALLLALQLIVPLCVIARDELSSRDFSWDMFSYHLSCQSLDVRARLQGQPWSSAPLARDFSSWAQLRRVLSEKRFSAYAEQLCREYGPGAELRIDSHCKSDRDSEPFAILDPNQDFCTPAPSAP